jgi:hypothetical protein
MTHLAEIFGTPRDSTEVVAGHDPLSISNNKVAKSSPNSEMVFWSVVLLKSKYPLQGWIWP